MRVSTAQIFENATLNMNRNQTDLFRLQNQISTGRRVLAPEDDPVASAQALVTTQSQQVNKQFLENQGNAKVQLTMAETTLDGVTNVIQYVRERAVQLGNGALGDDQRQAIATDLQQKFDELVALANAQNGEGLYLFSGFKGGTRPFSLAGNAATPYNVTNPSVSFNGDGGERVLQVEASRQMGVTVSGDDVFMRLRNDSGVNESLFDVFQNLIGIAQRPAASWPGGGAEFGQNLATSLSQLDRGLDNVLRVRATVGARLAELDSLETVATDLDVQFAERVSNLQDLDYAQAISDLTRKQVQLQAAQRSFVTISGLSLFNFL